MNSRTPRDSRGGRRRAQPSKVLIFAENLNDSRSIAQLVVAANPDLAGRVEPKPRPISLTRTAGEEAVRGWVEQLKDVVAAARATGLSVAAVLVHRDADGPDRDGRHETALNQQLGRLPARAVVPVQMR